MPDSPFNRAVVLGLVLALVLAQLPVQAKPVEEATEEVAFAAALELLEEKQYDDAEGVLERLVKRDPKNGLYWFNLGGARYNSGRPGPAARAFEKVIALGSPLAPAAMLSLAKCRRKEQKWDAALRQLKKIPVGDPDVVTLVASERLTLRDAALEVGMKSYDEERFDEAQAAFRVANEIAPDPDVTLMIGIALMRLDRNVEAERALGRFQRMTQDTRLRDDTSFFLNRIEQRAGEGPVWVSTEVALGYNSNEFLDPVSSTPDKRAVLQTVLHAGWRVYRWGSYAGDLSYLLYWDEALGDVDGRFLSQTVRADLGYSSEGWRARLSPSFQYQRYGTDPFLFKPSLLLQVQRSFHRFWAGGQYELGRNYGQLSDYRHLDGNTHSLRLSWGYSPRNWDVGFSYALFADSIGDLVTSTTTLPLRSTGHGPFFRLAWEPSLSWEASLTFGLLFRSFATLAQPGNLKRKDEQFSTSLRVAHKLSPAFQLFGSLHGLVNHSTLDSSSNLKDKNYGQVLFLTGASWDILN